MTLFGSQLWTRSVIPRGEEVDVAGMSRKGIVHRDGLCLFGSDGKPVSKHQEDYQLNNWILMCFLPICYIISTILCDTHNISYSGFEC